MDVFQRRALRSEWLMCEQQCAETCTDLKYHPKCRMPHDEGSVPYTDDELNLMRSKEECDGRSGCGSDWHLITCSFWHEEGSIPCKILYNRHDMISIEKARNNSIVDCESCTGEIYPPCKLRHPKHWKVKKCYYGFNCLSFQDGSFCFYHHTKN